MPLVTIPEISANLIVKSLLVLLLLKSFTLQLAKGSKSNVYLGNNEEITFHTEVIL